METKAEIRKTWQFSRFLFIWYWVSSAVLIYQFSMSSTVKLQCFVKTAWLTDVCDCLKLKWGSLILTAWKHDIGMVFSGLHICKCLNIWPLHLHVLATVFGNSRNIVKCRQPEGGWPLITSYEKFSPHFILKSTCKLSVTVCDMTSKHR